MGKSSLSAACTSPEAIDVISPSPRKQVKSMRSSQLTQLRKQRNSRRSSHHATLTRENQSFGLEGQFMFLDPVKPKDILVEQIDQDVSDNGHHLLSESKVTDNSSLKASSSLSV